MNDQTIKTDAGKPKVSLVPTQIIYDIAEVREYGNNKYPEGGKNNWKEVEPERYIDAAYRHFMAYLDDPHGVDEESGLPHLWHCVCNFAFICEMEKDKFGDVHMKLPTQSCAGDILASYAPPIMHRVEQNSKKSLWQAIKELLA